MMRFLHRKSRRSIAPIARASVGLAFAAALLGCADQEGTPPPAETQAASASEASEARDANAQLADLADRHAREILAAAPELATSLAVEEAIGGANYHAHLGSYNFAASEQARQTNERFLQELRAIDRDGLADGNLVLYDTLMNAYRLAARRNQFAFGGASEMGASRPGSGAGWAATPYMVTQLTGPHLYLPRLLQTQHALRTKDDADAYLARLDEFARVFDEVAATIAADAAQGVVPPRFVIEGARAAIAGFTDPAPGAHPLVSSFAERLRGVADMSDEARAQYGLGAEKRVAVTVYPAYARLDAALESTLAQASDDAGLWRLGPEGEAYYQMTLDAYGGGGKSGDEIHEIGLAEVARITDEMDALLRQAGYEEGSVAARMRALGGRSDNLFPNTDEGREALLALLREQVAAINEIAPDWFARLPDQEVEVRRIPAYEQDSSPGGYYSGPSLDGSRPGIYWINLKSTADNPIHSLKTLTYHEAVPGHHFQISLAQSADAPLIAKMLSYSEYAEGWALYAEKLAKEMGMYEDDPEGDLGRLQAELFRAARLVVDTGLHAKRWSREEAIDYMAGVTGETRESVTREIERYAAVPGQANAYKLGMLKMEELRARAEDALGEAFDIRAFHDAVLDTGAAPLEVLDARVNRWIEEARAGE